MMISQELAVNSNSTTMPSWVFYIFIICGCIGKLIIIIYQEELCCQLYLSVIYKINKDIQMNKIYKIMRFSKIQKKQEILLLINSCLHKLMIVIKLHIAHIKLKQIARFVFKILKKMIKLDILFVSIYFTKNVSINGTIIHKLYTQVKY